MKKKFMMEELDCAHCASKMEEAIKKIDGVNDASVSFFAQKLMIDADDDKFEAALEEAIKCIHKVNADTKVII